MKAKEAHVTFLVGGVAQLLMPIQDYRFTEDPPRSSRVERGGYVCSFELEAIGAIGVDFGTALDRWADDGGAVRS